MDDVMSVAALVAAYVGVIKALAAGTALESLVNRLSPVMAMVVAAVFVLVPVSIGETLTRISIIGLTASGAYALTKKKGGGGADV